LRLSLIVLSNKKDKIKTLLSIHFLNDSALVFIYKIGNMNKKKVKTVRTMVGNRLEKNFSVFSPNFTIFKKPYRYLIASKYTPGGQSMVELKKHALKMFKIKK
jgi:hypothetical protein